jgi:hypothetical protein
MASSLSWLDASTEEQRAMRDIVNLFTQKESREELGIGTMRDALSDLLFPGTSTLIGRARYLLLIPWCFEVGAASSNDPAEARNKADRAERDLIVALQHEPDHRGLIGMRVGQQLQNLPSTLYFGTMRRFGILSPKVATLRDAIAADIEKRLADSDSDVETGGWAQTLPAVPQGFPKNADGGFTLRNEEAQILATHIQLNADGTLLGHLVDNAPNDSSAPWLGEAALGAPSAVREVLDHARLFSFAIHGAALMYNLELAKAYEKAGFNRITISVDDYQTRFDDWRRDIPQSRMDRWDLNDFFDLILSQNPRILRRSRDFLSDWVQLCLNWDELAAANRIQLHERQQKQGQSRFKNAKLLELWSGASGDGELTFRWTQVKTLLTDIHEGLARDDALAV